MFNRTRVEGETNNAQQTNAPYAEHVITCIRAGINWSRSGDDKKRSQAEGFTCLSDFGRSTSAVLVSRAFKYILLELSGSGVCFIR